MREVDYDLVILGAGLSGIAAACGARSCGLSVLVLEQTFSPGGAATQSLVGPLQTFHSNRGRIIGGFASFLVDRLQKMGGALGYVKDPIGFAGSLVPVDSDILKAHLFQIMAEEGISLLLGATLEDVRLRGDLLAGIVLNGGRKISSHFFIDASGNGDLTFACGVPMEHDRDAQPMSLLFNLRGVDGREVIAYEKSSPDNFILHPQRDVLDRGYFAACGYFSEIARAKSKGEWQIPRDRVLFFQTVYPDEVVVNTTRVAGNALDPKILSQAHKEGIRQMVSLLEFFKKYIPGFGHAYLSHLPERIGIRETRRLLGKYVLGEEEIAGGKDFPDTIARGAFPLDIHSSKGDGMEALGIEGGRDYGIPLRCLLNDNVKNLLTVGKCISVTHRGFSSTRVMPTCMAVGQAGGVAAAVMLHEGCFEESRVIGRIQDELIRQGAILWEEQIVRDLV